MEKQTIVHSEGVVFTTIEPSNLKVNGEIISIIQVPIHFEKHGLVRAMFFGDEMEKMMNYTYDEKNHGKGLRFFFTGDIHISSFERKNHHGQSNQITDKRLYVTNFA